MSRGTATVLVEDPSGEHTCVAVHEYVVDDSKIRTWGRVSAVFVNVDCMLNIVALFMFRYNTVIVPIVLSYIGYTSVRDRDRYCTMFYIFYQVLATLVKVIVSIEAVYAHTAITYFIVTTSAIQCISLACFLRFYKLLLEWNVPEDI